MKNNFFKKIICLFLSLSLIISSLSLGILRVNAEDTVSISVYNSPNIDIVVTTGMTGTDMSTFKNDLFTEVASRGLPTDKINITSMETVEYNIQESLNWTQDMSSSIGNISIGSNGKNINMIGNYSLPGKNALYCFPGSSFKCDFNFNYNIAFGDSFNCAGLMLKVAQSGNTLTGYMLTFNNRNTCTVSGTTAAIWKFNWTIGTNSSNITFRNTTGTPTANTAYLVKTLALNTSGTLNTKIVGNTIEVNGGGLSTPVKVTCENSYTGTGFGFFSDHYSHGCSDYGNFTLSGIGLQLASSKSYSECLGEPNWRENAEKIIVNVDDIENNSFVNNTELASVLSKTLNTGIHFVSWGSSSNQATNEAFIASNNNKGVFINNTSYANSISKTADYLEQFFILDNETQTVVVGQDIEFNVNPESLKNNTANELFPNGRWYIAHDYQYYPNNTGQSIYANQYLDDLVLNFDKPGKYDIYFADRLIKTIYAHRKPTAVFTSKMNDLTLTLTSQSVDLDSNNDIGYGQGIKEELWQYKKASDSAWTNGKLTTLEEDTSYVVQLKVLDEQNVWSEPYTQHISTEKVDLPVVANFNYKNATISKYKPLEIIDLSYDPNNVGLTTYYWTLKKNGVKLGTTNQPITNFSSYEVGSYSYTLVVENGDGLKSDPYTRSFTLTEDINPPEMIINPTQTSWMQAPAEVGVQLSDADSGIKSFRYAVDNKQTTNSETNWSASSTDEEFNIKIYDDGLNFLHVEVEDLAGNKIERTTGPYRIDMNPATVDYEIERTTKDQSIIKLTVTDDASGVNKVILPNGSEDTDGVFEYPIENTGVYKFTTVDNAGNTDTLSINTYSTSIANENSVENVNYDSLTKTEGTDYFEDETTNVWTDKVNNASLSDTTQTITSPIGAEIVEETRVSVVKESEFTITIPKEIVLEGNTGTATYNVNAKGDIAGDQRLLVVPDSAFNMSEAGGKADVVATVTQPDTEYDYIKLQGDGTTYTGNIAAALSAGEWSGSFYFDINFVNDIEVVDELGKYVLQYKTTSNTEYQTQEFNTYNELKNFVSGNDTLTDVVLANDGTTKITNTYKLFANCTNLTSVDISGLDTSNITNMNYMFYGCSSLTRINTTNINTSNVKSMRAMFKGCSSLTTLNLVSFNTLSVNSIDYMFADCTGLTTITVGDNWNIDNITNKEHILLNCNATISK